MKTLTRIGKELYKRYRILKKPKNIKELVDKAKFFDGGINLTPKLSFENNFLGWDANYSIKFEIPRTPIRCLTIKMDQIDEICYGLEKGLDYRVGPHSSVMQEEKWIGMLEIAVLMANELSKSGLDVTINNKGAEGLREKFDYYRSLKGIKNGFFDQDIMKKIVKSEEDLYNLALLEYVT